MAVVAAETPQIAREALKLIEVDYEPLPAILDAQDALRGGDLGWRNKAQLPPLFHNK